MTSEEQAIEELTNMVMGEEPQQVEEAPQVEEKAAKEPEVKVDVAEIIKNSMAEQSKRFEEKISELSQKIDKPNQEEMSEEEIMLQQAKEKLGLQEMQKQQEEMYQAYQKQMQQQQMQEKLDKMEADFTKENPNIKLKELDEWATENGLTEQMQLGFQSGNVAIWNVLANAMQKVARVAGKPDPITPTASKGAETTVWEKQRKGDEFSDIALGADLLKTAGLLD